MPYPPPVPPVNRTNATPSVDNHPGDHNVISEALTEILNHIAELETHIHLDGGFENVPFTPISAGGGLIHAAIVPPVPFATRMFVSAACGLGSDSGVVAGIKFCILTQVPGTNQPFAGGISTGGANDWGYMPLEWSWAVPPSGSSQFALHTTWSGGAPGQVYAQADITWQRYRT